jgi:hypothetical protein
MVRGQGKVKVGRGEFREVVTDDGRRAVSVGGRTMVLSEVATAILQALPESGGAALDAVTAAVVEAVGSPEPPLDAESLTREQVHDLVAHGVLVIEDGATVSARRGTPTPAGVAALRDALRSTVGSGLTWTLPDTVTAEEFLDAAARHRVVSQVVASGRVVLPDQASGLLRAEDAILRLACDRLVDDLQVALDALAAAEVRALVFKGVALAAQAWGDPGARGYGDADLLVAPSDLERAYEALAAAGCFPVAGYPRPGPSWAWRHFVRTSNEVPLHMDGGIMDLHWYLSPARSTFPDFATLWARRATVEVGGHPLATLSAYDALAHSAGHAAKDHWRWLRGLLDVHRLMALPGTWELADRPLRDDQLMTVGLAAQLFGTPPGAPEVVRTAREGARTLLEPVHAVQVAPEHIDAARRVPGHGVWRVLTSHRRTGASLGDHARQLASLLAPPSATHDQTSPHAVVALPRALRARAAEVVPLWRDALRRSR